jgi:hypothetical protein
MHLRFESRRPSIVRNFFLPDEGVDPSFPHELSEGGCQDPDGLKPDPENKGELMRHLPSWSTFVLGTTLLAFTATGFAKSPTCSPIGGAIITNLGGFGQIDGTPTTLGVATGDLKGALGVQIVSASADFTTITVQHHWVTDNGETLVVDQAQAHGVFVAPGLLAVTDYKVHLSGGTGRYANATADTTVIGEVDFNTGHAVLRYSGTLCFAAGK